MLGPITLHQIISCLNPYDDEEVDVGASAVGLTPSKVLDCQAVSIYFYGGDMRYRIIGSDPTASVGIPIYADSDRVLGRLEAIQLRMIRTGVTNGKAYATYYK